MKFSPLYRLRLNYNRFRLLRKTFRNYFFISYHVLLRNYPFEGLLRTGMNVLITNFLTLGCYAMRFTNVNHNLDFDYVDFTFNNRDIRLFGISTNGDLSASFSEYKFLKVKEKVVLDIGANIGDSSIYFVAEGASNVIAVEPVNETFEILSRNILINNMQDRIIPLRYNISNMPGNLKMSVGNALGTGTVLIQDQKDGYEVQNVTLKELMLQFNLNDGVLKMDCEGCEYNTIIETDSETLRKFSQIQIEYHKGYSNLEDKLVKAGFQVTHTKPVRINAQDGVFLVGYIYAERNNQDARRKGSQEVVSLMNEKKLQSERAGSKS